MKKGQIIEGVIECVDFPNKGIIRTEDGRQVIVKNTIPGQKVSASINKSAKESRGQTFRGIGKVTAGRGQNRMCPCRGMWRMYLSDTSIRQAA